MSKRTYLEEIEIRNLGIIESSTLEFGKGLNVLTGETGAGKTMILTALNLVLGEKSDSSLVRHGSDRLVATATFACAGAPDLLQHILSSADIDQSDQLILSRSVTAEGKSKATANSSTVTAAFLADVTTPLIEIHGQSANLQIQKASKQREVVDRFGGSTVESALNAYQDQFVRFNDLKARIASMKKASSQRDSEIAELQEFHTGWVALKPVRNEFSSTNDEISRLSSVEDLRTASSAALQALNDEESGSLTATGAALKFLATSKGRDSHLDAIAERINEAFFTLDESSSDLASYSSSLEADPARLQYLQERKSALTAFIKKWGGSGDPDAVLVELSAKAKSAKENLADLSGGDERISELEKELANCKKELLAAARALTRVRIDTGQVLAQKVTKELAQLSMPHTTLVVDVKSADYDGTLKESDFTSFGCDEISLGIKAHKDAPVVAIGKGVSGGEMSRIMLAISVVIADTYPLGTYVFDEVDAGVGGKAAIEVGRRLHLLSQSAQVIVVTHLPQVAAWADTHFKVEKESDGVVVASGVRTLKDEARVDEIARMLAGLEESVSAREHATELLAMKE